MTDVEFCFDSLNVIGAIKSHDGNIFVLVQGCYIDSEADEGEGEVKTCVFEIRERLLEELFHKWLVRKWELCAAYKEFCGSGNISVHCDDGEDTFELEGENVKVFQAYEIGAILIEA